MINYLICFGVDMLALCLKMIFFKKKKKKKKPLWLPSPNSATNPAPAFPGVLITLTS